MQPDPITTALEEVLALKDKAAELNKCYDGSGPQAEEALIKGLRRFRVYDPQHLINLDRLHSTRCGEFVSMLVGAYGCIIYRGQPENLMYDPTPLQRVCTNLILRSGRGPEVADLVLREMEGRGVDEEIPEDLPAFRKKYAHLDPTVLTKSNQGITFLRIAEDKRPDDVIKDRLNTYLNVKFHDIKQKKDYEKNAEFFR